MPVTAFRSGSTDLERLDGVRLRRGQPAARRRRNVRGQAGTDSTSIPCGEKPVSAAQWRVSLTKLAREAVENNPDSLWGC